MHQDVAPSLYDLPSIYDQLFGQSMCEGFYRRLAGYGKGAVLELACGTGRLTIPLALDGHQVIGLDSSLAMLNRASVKSRAEGIAVDFRLGDMRSFDLGRRFALIIVSCNSLAHLTTDADMAAALACIRRHLAPDGIFAFDIANPQLDQFAAIPEQDADLNHRTPTSGTVVERLLGYDPVGQIRTLQWAVSEDGEKVHSTEPMNLRVIFPEEVPMLLARAGLELIERHGDFEGEEFSAASHNQVCLAGHTRQS